MGFREAVASPSRSMGPYRATTTHFGPFLIFSTIFSSNFVHFMLVLDSRTHPDGSGTEFCSGMVVSASKLVVSDLNSTKFWTLEICPESNPNPSHQTSAHLTTRKTCTIMGLEWSFAYAPNLCVMKGCAFLFPHRKLMFS